MTGTVIALWVAGGVCFALGFMTGAVLRVGADADDRAAMAEARKAQAAALRAAGFPGAADALDDENDQ